MNSTLKIILVQADFLVGAIEANTKKMLSLVQTALSLHSADIIVFPELSLTGYLLEDLVLRSELKQRVKAAIAQLIQELPLEPLCIIGYPEYTPSAIYNSAVAINHGQIVANYRKQCLPNYGVFDEKRYFVSGHQPCVLTYHGLKLGMIICEDLWFAEPLRHVKQAGANLAVCINASPFEINKQFQRQTILQQRATENNLPILYVNMVGGQDELIFDGGSCSVDRTGKIIHCAELFDETLLPIIVEYLSDSTITSILSYSPRSVKQQSMHEKSGIDTTPLVTTAAELDINCTVATIYQALVVGVKDYVNKNNFYGVLIGLSGGIDSAVSLSIAVDALGKERVWAVSMPSSYTAEISIVDAQLQANNLGVKYSVLPINEIFQTFLATLADEFKGLPADLTEENLQARCRGMLLMALSNKTKRLVLTTGNKSEVAVGYATLYGDMAGGFCVLKDVLKTWVYRLAEYRNRLSPVIPQRVITRPPSAELAPNQKDEDSLPPYPILDQIIQRYVEEDETVETIIAAGFAPETVTQVIALIERNEYKRRQAPLGPRITKRSFGRDRRYPITSGFR